MQDEEGVGGQDDPGVQHTVLQHGPLRPQGSGHRPDEQEAQQGDDPAAHRRRQHQQGEVLVGQRRLPLPQSLGHDGRAAGAHHEAQCAQDHQHGIDQVDCGKGGLANEVRDEHAVHHAVDGCKNHHHNRRQGEA